MNPCRQILLGLVAWLALAAPAWPSPPGAEALALPAGEERGPIPGPSPNASVRVGQGADAPGLAPLPGPAGYPAGGPGAMDRGGAALLGRPGDFLPVDPDFVDVEFQEPAAPAPGALPDGPAPDGLAPAGSAPGAPGLDGPVPVAVGLPEPPARIPGNINGLGEREIEEALLDREGGEVAFGGGLFVWQGDQLFRREPDGTLSPTGSLLSPNDTSLDDEGLEWLRQSEDGGALIQVTLRVWATINFEYNSDAILPDSENVLETFGQALNRPALRDKRLLISGHADSTGPADFNLGLSRRRAASVGRWLAEKGHLSPDRLILAGYGASMPIADNGTEEGRALNRRVEFILVN